jgi:hypothetical protein
MLERSVLAARRVLGVAMLAAGIVLALSPIAVADALGLPRDTSTRMINLRASWGGTLTGLGAFVAWLPAVRPWSRALVGLVGWTMAGIGAARLVGFAVDGSPDARQYVWITAEVALAVGSAVVLRVLARRRAA